MKNFIIIAFLILLSSESSAIFSQNEPDSIHHWREKWFKSGRVYPYDTLQQQALIDGLSQRDQLATSQGYMSAIVGWSNIGPISYEQGSTRYTGRTAIVKYNPLNPNTVFIGGANGGVWKTLNSQSSPNTVVFSPLTDRLVSLSSGDIVIDPNDTNTIYYSSGMGTYFFVYTYYGRGIFKSTNGGTSWTGPFNSGLPPLTTIFRMVINPTNSNEIYIAEKRGLFKSTDAGINWNRILPNSFSPSRQCNDVAISNDGQKIYAVGPSEQWTWNPVGDEYKGIEYCVSTDGGSSFNKISGTGFHPSGRTHLIISPSDNNVVYAITGNISNGNIYSYRSTDGGMNFIDSVNVGNNSGMFCTFLCIAVSPATPLKIIIGWGTGTTNSLFRSTDGGASYPLISQPYADVNSVAFHPTDSNQALIGCDGGLFISTNINSSPSWSSLNATLELSQIFRIASNPYDAENIFIGVEDNGFLQKDRNSELWYSRQIGWDGTNVIWSPYDNSVLIGSTGTSYPWGWNLWPSGNKGASWTNVSITGIWDGGNDWIATLETDPRLDSAGVYYHARRTTYTEVKIQKSTNDGLSWSTNSGISPISVPDSGSPQTLTICEMNPNVMYVSTRNWYGGSKLWRTINGGEEWVDLDIYSNGVPQRDVTNITTDPANENELYLAVSGLGSGHVYRSTNKGSSWSSISGTPSPSGEGLPDLPVNNLVLRYTSCTEKEIFVGTDAGVFRTIVGTDEWQEVADNLPNSVVMGMDLNILSGKLRVGTFGRGAWEFELSGPIYVTGTQILNSDLATTSGLNVADDIIVCSGGKLLIPYSCTIKMKSGKKIIIEEGGTIIANNNVPITIASQSGTWGGIEFQGTGTGTLKNCTFQNTSTPVVIESSGSSETPHPEILINNCTFYSPVEISNRPDVTVSYCNFSYSSGSVPSVLGVASSGSDDILITNNTITSGSAISSAGISIVYGSDVVVQKNVITNMAVGLSISNTSPFVFQNRITNSTASDAVVGIGFDNSYSATVKQNTVIGYQIGYKLFYSSPLMYEDSSYNTNTSGDSVNSLHAVYISNPRLKPDDNGDELIWHGGKNMLKTTAKGNGIYMYISSIPDIDYGYNEVYGYDDYLFGDGAPFVADHYVRCNDWVDDPPNSGKFNLSNPQNIIYTPYGCTPPGGSGLSSDPLKDMDEPIEAEETKRNPPQNIIVSYGGGVYDTVKVTSRSFELSIDQQLYGQGVKEELLGNYSTAITKYKSVIENYQDSTVSINAMKKILICHEKMNANSASYDNLRDYYLNLIQSNPTDTAFVKAAKEQAIKTLIKKGSYSSAISQYEDIVSSSSDPYEIFCSELNIIETYMIMIQEGDTPGFTGRLANLKPVNSKDGHKMLLNKLYNLRSSQVISVVPKQFSLSQNYPNPFNPKTKINYSLPNSVKVTIVVYDILGRVVKSLVNEFKEAGTHSVSFDGTWLASGVYFYRIEAGDFVASKKMVLVK